MDIGMPGYVKEAIHNFQHPDPRHHQHSPYQRNTPNYDSTAPQLAHQAPESPNPPPSEANIVKQVVGTFMYYMHAVNPTMIVALNSIATEQANSTEATTKAVTKLWSYHKIPCKRYDPPHPQHHLIPF